MDYAAEHAAEGTSTGSMIFSLIFSILAIVGLWKMFVKAGEPGWKSIIPLYNAYIMFKLVWGKGWMFLLLLIPIVDIVIYIMFSWKLAKAYGKGAGMGILCILLPSIAYIVLGFGNAEYIGPQ